jgi:hypothetical protein
MIKACTITPTRSDRNKLLGFNISRIKIQTIVVMFPPESEAIDIVPRVKHGIQRAKEMGYEYAIIVEDDDYYPKDYFDFVANALQQYDFVGFCDTFYYNIKEITWQKFDHPGRSSLFTTALRVSALDDFNWPNDNEKFLDVKIWEHVHRTLKSYYLFPNNPALGIKGHGFGKAAGKGHVMSLENKDEDLSFFRSRVDDEAFEFYTKLKM